MFSSRPVRLFAIFASLFMAFSMISVTDAEARRGGSFGSRGLRTFQSAPPTVTAPNQVAPVQRTMTPGNGVQQQTAQPGAVTNPAGRFGNGFGGALMRGLFFGGLFGLLMGTGFGGFGGLGSLLMQLLLIGAVALIAMRFFAPRTATANGARINPYAGSGLGSGYAARPSAAKPSGRRWDHDEIGVTQTDLDQFEGLLKDVQDAYSREDYSRLRQITTPEVMGYLSEELGQNASQGLKNEVSHITLLSGDVAESWREGAVDYASVALRYSSIDVTRERESGRVVEGDPERPSEAVELWTFIRHPGEDWKLSAIQEA